MSFEPTAFAVCLDFDFFPHVRRRRDRPRSHLPTPPPRLGDPAAAPSTSTPPTRSERQRGRGMAKARSSAKQSRAQAQQSSGGGGGHALSSKLARYLDPEASWDKVRPAPRFPARAPVAAAVLTLSSPLGRAVAGPTAGRGALDPPGGGAHLRPALGSRPPRRRRLDCTISPPS